MAGLYAGRRLADDKRSRIDDAFHARVEARSKTFCQYERDCFSSDGVALATSGSDDVPDIRGTIHGPLAFEDRRGRDAACGHSLGVPDDRRGRRAGTAPAARRRIGAGAYQVVFVEAIEGAHSRIAQTMPDRVILCCDLDDESGFQLLSMLKADRRTRNIPALTCIGYLGPDQRFFSADS